MMQLFLGPMDVWLFRDGRPFTATSDHRAVSLFPPYPSVVQGVIRSHQLIVEAVDLHNSAAIAAAVGTSEDFKNLRLRGPFLAKWEDGKLIRYYPVPADMVAQGEKFVALQLRKPENADLITSAPTEQLLYSAVEPTKKLPGQWLTEQNLRLALQNKAVKAIEHHELFVRESRYGIARQDDTRTTREQAFYEVEFICPCPNVGLYLEVSGYTGWKKTGVLRMGGEGRGATYEVIETTPLPLLEHEFRAGELPSKFKVYFATPTFFNQGWLPDDWGKFFSGKVKLIAAALNRYESLGGFDWAKNTHKPARRFVPAASVYYFEAKGKVTLTDEVLETNAISDEGAQIGLGQIFIQEVNHV
ncbi:MAG: type III-B CRISPR module-associated protein Cmr3 [Anaerolineales bacterium]